MQNMQIFIETNRLLLRELVPSDATGMFELDADAEVHRYLGNKPIATMEEARQVIAFIRDQYLQNGIGRWAVIEKATGDFVGWSGLKLIKETTNGHINYYDLGYRLLKKHWEKGYATESAKATVEYGFNTLCLPVIYAMADVQNMASRNVLLKTGLQYIETFDLNGVLHDWFKKERLGQVVL
jgi:[ribosomal protein S5]-alanine N-acetyltransferase